MFTEPSEYDFQSLFTYEGLDPYIFEKEFSKIEEKAIAAIKGIIYTKKMPDEEKFSYVVNLMGIFGARNFIVRDELVSSYKVHFIKKMDSLVKDEESYNLLMEHLQEKGIIDKPEPYIKAKKFVAERNFKIELAVDDIDDIVMEMVKESANLTDWLAQKNWLIVEAKDSEFLSSNFPVAIIEVKDINSSRAVDFVVIFPLSSHIALIGSSFSLPSYNLINRDVVEGINYCMVYRATKFFAAKKRPSPLKENLGFFLEFYRSMIAIL